MSAPWSDPAVVIVTGIQASGKSTIGRLLSEKLERAAFIDGDALSRMVVTGRTGMTPDPSAEAVSELHLRYRQAAFLAESFHGAGFTAVMADNIYGEDLAHQVDRICSSPLIVVVLAPRNESVVARELARRTGAYRDWMRDQTLEAAVVEFHGYLGSHASDWPLARHHQGLTGSDGRDDPGSGMDRGTSSMILSHDGEQHRFMRLAVDFEIRPARSPDLELLTRWNTAVDRVVTPTLARQGVGEAVVLLAMLGHYPFGHLLVDFTSRAPSGAAHLWHMAVHASVQNRGIGSKLITSAEGEATARGLRFAELEVDKDNTAALRLYRRLGYEVIGESNEVWPEEGDDGATREVSHPCWQMRRELRPEPVADANVVFHRASTVPTFAGAPLTVGSIAGMVSQA